MTVAGPLPFWSCREDAEITEEKIGFVIRGLREHGGMAGYKVAAENERTCGH